MILDLACGRTAIGLGSPGGRACPRGTGVVARLLFGAIFCVVGGLLGGCANAGSGSTAGGRAEKDRLLHAYRQAAERMQARQFTEAKIPLDDSIASLGGLTAGDRSARQARGLFRKEDVKNFRGEPYERVMAYYYRGILYWMDGEMDNARACFRSGQIQDAEAAEGRYRSDYVLLDYLDGLATAKLAGDGSDGFRRAVANVRGATPPPLDPAANVLVFIEMGRGPTKVAAGGHGERLQYLPGSGRAISVRVQLGGQVVVVPWYDDLTFQATSRGGRVMDGVLANKARFKEGTGAFGDAAILSGAVLGSQQGYGSNVDEIGAGLLIAGVISKIVSSVTTPHADVRCWDNLPNTLGFGALSLPVGNHSGTVEFLDSAGRVLTTQSVSFTVVAGRDTVLFFSDRN